MKFTISQSELSNVLQRMISIIPTKTTIPILTNILFELRGQQLKLTGTDLEVSIITLLNANVETEGIAAFPAKKIFDLIRELPDTPLEFEADQVNRLTIKTEKGTYKIAGEASEEYPHIAAEEQKHTFSYPANRFIGFVEKTLFAVSTDELRTTLMGVSIELSENEIKIVSTDGHRLVKIVDHDFKYEGEATQVIVPVKALHLLSRNLDQTEQIEIGISRDHIVFKLGNSTIYSKVISGQYPAYERVIPADNQFEMIVDRDLLSSTVRRSMIFANQHTRQIIWSLQENALTVKAEDVETGGNSQETIAVEYAGDQMDIGYNASYILEILRHLDTEQIKFKLNDPGSAAIIEPLPQNENVYLMMLLMPIRLND